jgi:hypothetical protein
MLLFAGIWGCYVAGAAAGAWGEVHVGRTVLTVPVAGLAVLIAWDLARPIVLARGAGQERDWQV